MWKWLLLTFALSFCFFAIQSGDVMMNLVIARDFILRGEWRQTDVLGFMYPSYDRNFIWAHQYLSSLIFYGAWWIAGFPALIFLKSAILGLMFWLALRADEERNAAPEWIALWALAVVAASFRFIERASLFSDLFTLLTAAWLLRESRMSRSLALRLTLLFTLWTQLHPGFVFGFALIFAWLIWHTVKTRDFVRANLLWLLVIPFAMLANPESVNGLTYPFRFALNETRILRLYNFEWLPPYHSAFALAHETVAFWILSVTALYYFARGHQLRSKEFLFALTAFVMALQSVRFVPVAALLIVLAVKPFARLRIKLPRRRTIQAGIAVLLLLVTVRNVGWGYKSSSGRRLPTLGLDPKFFPFETLATMAEIRARGPFYNSQDFGAYLLWLGIKPIFHHGFVTDMKFYRSEAVGALESGDQFFALAKKYGWKVLLVDRFGGYRRLHAILSPYPEWRILAEDEASYLSVRSP